MMASAPTMFRYVSCCPANEAVAPSSSTAEERTAAMKSGRLWQAIRSEMAVVISLRRSSGCTSSITITGREKPSGTRWYMRARRLRFAALPPTRATSKDWGSPNQSRFIRFQVFDCRLQIDGVGLFSFRYQPHDTGIAIHFEQLPVLERARGIACAN